MTLDEAIIHAEEVAEQNRNDVACYQEFGHRYGRDIEEEAEEVKECIACAEQHEQLAEWLKELKSFREKAEKYKWHDLRKNPEDLPDELVDVQIIFEYHRYGDYNGMCTAVGMGYCHNGKMSDFVNGESGWHDLKILAWRYVEPPESEDTE